MAFFGWIAQEGEPPPSWDLRLAEWDFCKGQSGCRAECRHVLICDVRSLTPEQRAGITKADSPAWRLILLGVEEAAERAKLLTLGCAEAVPCSIQSTELQARARRVNEMFDMLPRWRNVGPLILDLFHRDGRKGAQWLGLHPREFGLIWRLSDTPGVTVTRKQLLEEVWRINHDPETNSVEVHVSRLRSKLAQFDCANLVKTSSEGGYRLSQEENFMLADKTPEADALDCYLRSLKWNSPATIS